MRYIATFGFHAKHIFDNDLNFIGVHKKVSDAILIYSVEDYATNEDRQKIENTKEELKSKFEKLEIPYIIKKVDEPYKFSENVKRFRKYIVPKTLINLTGGKRVVGYALFYASILEKDNVEKVIYVPRIGEIIELPLVSPDVTLTHLEEQILELLNKKEYMYVSEIARELSKSVSTVSEYLSRLEKKGLIKKIYEGRKRRIERLI